MKNLLNKNESLKSELSKLLVVFDTQFSKRLTINFEKIPLKRVAQTEEIAAAAVFLASDENTLITGQAINVDGGMEMN